LAVAVKLPPRQYRLWVQVVDWYDGDTFHGILDQCLDLFHGAMPKPPRMRCAIIDTPEMETPDGMPALAYAYKIAPPGHYECWATKRDEYGRPLLDLILPSGEQYSSAMLRTGHAVPYRA
jgi:endonuclease YncB( thermonuclease family)